MPIQNYNKARADAMAANLRRIAEMLDRGEIQYVATLALLSQSGAHAHGYALEQHVDVIEEIGIGTYLMKLGALRDFFLTAENQLMEIGMATVQDLTNRSDEPRS